MSMNVGDSTDLIHGGGGGIRVFWLSRTNMEKGLLITVGVMTLLIIGLFIGVGVLAGKANEASSNPQPAPEVPTPLPEATDPASQAPTNKATHQRSHISPPHTHLPTTTTHPNPRPHISPTHPPTHSPTSATHPQTHTSPPHTHPPITTSHSQTHTSPPHIQSTTQLPSVANMPSRAHG